MKKIISWVGVGIWFLFTINIIFFIDAWGPIMAAFFIGKGDNLVVRIGFSDDYTFNNVRITQYPGSKNLPNTFLIFPPQKQILQKDIQYCTNVQLFDKSSYLTEAEIETPDERLVGIGRWVDCNLESTGRFKRICKAGQTWSVYKIREMQSAFLGGKQATIVQCQN